jgi:tetratricopeptide (TPR) repeat protein
VRVQKEGHTPSNHGDFVDAVLRQVADLAAQGDYAGAGGALAQALAEEDAAHRARKSRLRDSAAEVAMLEGDADAAAGHLIARADLDAGGRADLNDLRALQDRYHAKGRDRGTALDLEIAIALARLYHTRARTEDERGAALNDLGNSRAILGDRESDPARLEAAIAAFRAALDEMPRDRVPLDWAATQQNLGNALRTLGARESGTARLEDARAAFRAALEEWTRDRVPLQWAMGQGNLAGLECAFFDKTGEPAHLDQAEGHARAAREVFVAAGASQYVGMIDNTLAAITERRGG